MNSGVKENGFRSWAVVVQLVEEQAEDEGLWFVAVTAPEAYLQQELRRLHATIEAADAISRATSTRTEGLGGQ